MKSAASSSALPPISPIMMMLVVSGSARQHFQHFDVLGALHRIAADADAGGLAKAGRRGPAATAS